MSGRRIVICGGGAIGVAVAYFLSRRGARPIVIERHEVAGAASGKSGGFLALDWCRGTPLDRLARRSFALHAELADELGNPWGYRRLETYAGHAAESDTARARAGRPASDRGCPPSVALTGRLGSPQTTALVEPRAFTMGLMRAAEAQGAELRHGTVVDLVREPTGCDPRRRARQRRHRRGRRRGRRHGAVVDPGDALAAPARGVRLQGPQPRVQDRRGNFPRRRCSSSTRKPAARS